MRVKSNFCLAYIFFTACFLAGLIKSDIGYTAESIHRRPSVEACEYVVSNTNKGQLDKILITSEPWNSSKINGPKDIGFVGIVFRKLMDINNDGTSERVFVGSEGTMNGEHLYVYDLNTDQEIKLHTSEDDDWESDNLRWALAQALIQFEGVYYVLGKTNQSLHYLAYINPKNEMKVVCEFGQRENPIQRLKTSNNKKICELDTIEYNVNFDKQHSITHNILQNSGFRETMPSKEAALIDVNNDGTKELVIYLDLASGAGRGCDSKYLGVLTPDRSSIDKEFTKKLPQGTCGGKVIPFIVGGKTYLDVKEEGPYSEHRQIYILEKDQLKTACEFEVRPDNYVLSNLQKIEHGAKHQDLWEYAISQPGTNAVETLIKGGHHLNISKKDIVDNPLDIAIRHKRYDLLEMLLKAGADPSFQTKGRFLDSPLVYAVYEDMPHAVELLLKYGAKLNKISCDNALALAISNGSVEMLELLLKSGIAITDRRAIEAVMNNNSDKHKKLRLLIKYGLDVNEKYGDRMVVVDESSGLIVVDPKIKTKKVTKTLLELAQESGDPEAVKILIDAGAKRDDKSLLQ